MITTLTSNYIALETDFEGYFKVSISSKQGALIFCETMMSNNKRILLKGFSLKEHTVTIAPLKLSL